MKKRLCSLMPRKSVQGTRHSCSSRTLSLVCWVIWLLWISSQAPSFFSSSFSNCWARCILSSVTKNTSLLHDVLFIKVGGMESGEIDTGPSPFLRVPAHPLRLELFLAPLTSHSSFLPNCLLMDFKIHYQTQRLHIDRVTGSHSCARSKLDKRSLITHDIFPEVLLH